ncbi:AraC family transcriptional regulator [Burkholderia sp. 567]|uniref:AraC family transcriptional regulator n=1 Tax=Burkholderia sp. 567 TaxID=3156413 RepID=UPI00339157D1
MASLRPGDKSAAQTAPKETGRVERSGSGRDWMRVSSDDALFYRIEAFFRGRAYGPHRHDTYAVGITTAGIQSIRYRGELVHSSPGDTVVIHPDEIHDGRAGTVAGYCYRIVHLQPEVLQQILGQTSLPFIKEGVSQNAQLYRAIWAMLREFDRPLEPLERTDLLFDLATALQAAAGTAKAKHTGNIKAALIARDCIRSAPSQRIELDVLARESGRDRWSLSRDFRQFFGTSPSRYMTMRRLDIARRLISNGTPLAECAAAVGFADQSHMSRQFVEAFGLTPTRWLTMLR